MTPKNNLGSLYMVTLAVCNTEVKNHVRAVTGFKEWDRKLDTLAILKEI